MEVKEKQLCPRGGTVTILQEKPDYSGYDTILPTISNCILDYGRSMFPWILMNSNEAFGNTDIFKIANVFYGDGRPVGKNEEVGISDNQVPYPANNNTISSFDSEVTYPQFVNTSSPNTALGNINALESDLFNAVEFFKEGIKQTDVVDVKYLRFRQNLHHQMLFNTAFGDPRVAIFNKFESNIRGSTENILSFNDLCTLQNGGVDIAQEYPRGSFEWRVTFVATMSRSCVAIVEGEDKSTFKFNEIMLSFDPNVHYDNSENTQKHSGIAMRYLPDITKVDGLGILIYWTLIF